MLTPPCTDAALLCWIEAHPGVASWLQAIFSVAAIGIAIVVPLYVQELDRHRRQSVLVQSTRQAAAVMTAAIKTFALSMAEPDKFKLFAETGKFPPHQFAFAEAAMASVSVNDIENADLSLSFRKLCFELMGCMTDLARLPDYADDDDDEGAADFVRDLGERAERAEHQYDTISALADAMRRRWR